MTLTLDVSYADGLESGVLPSAEQLAQWAQAAYRGDAEVYVALRVVDEPESQALNAQYRGKDKPTNVLSFPMEMELPEGEMPILGDLAVCAAVVQTEAAEQGKTSHAHWAHMLVHGVLHLQGYDHIEEVDAERMEGLEREILADLGYPDPYLISAT